MTTALLLALLPLAAQDTLRLGSPFTDHMVLQRETRAAIWGAARPGEAVSIETSWDGAWTVARADAEGLWSAELVTPRAGGPHRIEVKSDSKESVTLEDVLVGEVWVCSGQSNMEWPMTAIDDAAAEIAASDHPRIRLFDVAHAVALEPQRWCEGTWRAATPETVQRFSAVGLLFGRALEAQLDVPIGLIGTNWGGTPAEAWTSAETLRARFPSFDATLDRVDEALANPGAEPSLSEQQARFWTRVEQAGPIESSFEPTVWERIELPATFASVERADFDGCLWFRREVRLSSDWLGEDVVLELGPVDDMDRTWFNGELIGRSDRGGLWNTPRSYTIPAGLLREGTNTILVAAVDTGGVGRVGNADHAMRLVRGEANLAVDGTWSWSAGASMQELGGWPARGWYHQNSPSSLSNGMLAPLIPYAMRGAIWYQGESNRPRAAQYRTLFPAMITDWRTRWGRGDFPFYFVQIAPFAYGGDTGQAAELREAQLLTTALANTGMAVTMDIGSPADIHPRNKQDVAKRLARLALRETYGKDVLAYGPTYRAMDVEGDAIRLSFDHANGLRTDGEPLRTFTIAGADRVFHEAQATIQGSTIVVRSDAVREPVAVRFAWGAADQPNLWNAAGLPSSSFRTDDWPAVSRAE